MATTIESEFKQAKKEIGEAEEFLAEIWEEKDKKRSVEDNRLQALRSKIQSILPLIEELQAEENVQDLAKSKKDAADEVRQLRNHLVKLERERQLLNPESQQEFQQALWWFSQQGGRKELPLIQTLRAISPYTDDLQLQDLLERTHKEIEAKLLASGLYQVFCSESDIKELFPDVLVIEKYHAFVIISVDELTEKETISQIMTQYPVEKLNPESSQDFNVNKSFWVHSPPLGAKYQPGLAPGFIPLILGASSTQPDYNQGRITQRSEKILPDSTITIIPMSPKEQVVKFKFPVRQDWKKRIEDTNAKILQPLGNSEFVVSIPNDKILAEIKKFREVASVTPYEPTIRVQEIYLKELGTEITVEMVTEAQLKLIENPQDVKSSHIIPGILIANFFTDEDYKQAEKVLESHRIDIVDRHPDVNELIVDLIHHSDPLAAYEIIKQLPGLISLEEETIETTCNYHAVSLIVNGTAPVTSVPHDLTGKGEIIAIADTGLDLGETDLVHPDFKGRVRALESYPIRLAVRNRVHNPNGDDGASDKYSGHGTHVAGSALGNGTVAQLFGLPPIQGIAHEAELIFQAVEQTINWTNEEKSSFLNQREIPPASALLGIPSNLKQLFEFAYTNGARIHSNSWGKGDLSSYNRQCDQLDEFVWQHKYFLIVFAAGNKGNQPKTITPPGTAKNCLTVGALAEFSGRGPCHDGRLKPDVIAPGKFILSTRSHQLTHHSEAPYPLAEGYYMHMSGTSMATPLVAGSAALVRQYLSTQIGIDPPTAALLKAALIHSAEYICDRNGNTTWADNEQGWGRVNLSRIIGLPSPHQIVFFDQSQGFSDIGLFSDTGQQHKYQLKITDPSIPLRITLVYTDYPGERLVNNLNLFVYQSASQEWYVGNHFAGSVNRNNDNIDNFRDKVNNVEGCIIESPETGLWEIKIVASEISEIKTSPQDYALEESPQDYALVVSGAFVDWKQLP